MMQKMMKHFDATDQNVKEMQNDLSRIDQKVDAHTVSIKKLQQQFNQLSTTVIPLTTRGGKQTIDPPMPSEVQIVAERDDDEIKVTGEFKKATKNEVEVTQKVVPMPRPLTPFPHKLVKKTKDGKCRRFITIFKQFTINVSLIEDLEKIPGYAKFMMDLVTKKRAVSFENDKRLQHCSAIATRSIVQKKEVHGAFTIPCTTGLLHFVKALCDLGARFNLMPLSIYKK
ncbi:uncharacterized protein LOC125824281 [Solanum verrucosum]|uniref:uncharacterized protein LOC125824281 n=1 Tax=Solanum verrucosum TaxID=315347 RepID=UPI0020D19711|nr:uncharacterized protein LOC125824281 [Solanum verrucosum]